MFKFIVLRKLSKLLKNKLKGELNLRGTGICRRGKYVGGDIVGYIPLLSSEQLLTFDFGLSDVT